MAIYYLIIWYLEGVRPQPLRCLLRNLPLRFWLQFSLHLFFYVLPSWDLSVNLFLTLAKFAIYQTKNKAPAELNLGVCGAIFLLLHACLWADCY